MYISMIGPTMNPKIPKTAIPPRIPISIINGLRFVLLPRILERKIVSMNELSTSPVIITPIIVE